MLVPFLDLKRQYSNIQSSIDEAVRQVLQEQVFLAGHQVTKFEASFANAHQCGHAIGVGNATDALLIVLKALDIQPDDEVIVPAHGWLSAAEMVKLTGAKVVFVDVETDNFGIDPELLESKITPKTKAVIAIHLYGQLCKIEEIHKVCSKHNIALIEDCAQAHLASYNGRMASSWGLASVFSFYPSKILGAYGDGGAILSNDQDFSNRCRMIANHGGITKNNHQVSGLNSRLDAIQAAVLNIKLSYVNDWILKRNQIAAFYNKHLSELTAIETPSLRAGSKGNSHIYPIRTKHRDALKEYLAKAGISTEIHYPIATPFTKAFNLNFSPSDFPVSFLLQNELLSLPIYPELSSEELKYVIEQIESFFSKRKG